MRSSGFANNWTGTSICFQQGSPLSVMKQWGMRWRNIFNRSVLSCEKVLSNCNYRLWFTCRIVQIQNNLLDNRRIFITFNRGIFLNWMYETRVMWMPFRYLKHSYLIDVDVLKVLTWSKGKIHMQVISSYYGSNWGNYTEATIPWHNGS